MVSVNIRHQQRHLRKLHGNMSISGVSSETFSNSGEAINVVPGHCKTRDSSVRGVIQKLVIAANETLARSIGHA